MSEALTTAIHLGDEEIPWVEIPDGSLIKVVYARVQEGLWIIRNRFKPGFEVPTHKHTGPVFGYTASGAWKYKEYEYVNRAGSFLYEPAGSVHTLMVPGDNTEDTDVWFQIYGANLNLHPDGSIESVVDAKLVSDAYFALCEMQGLPRPNVVTD